MTSALASGRPIKVYNGFNISGERAKGIILGETQTTVEIIRRALGKFGVPDDQADSKKYEFCWIGNGGAETIVFEPAGRPFSVHVPDDPSVDGRYYLRSLDKGYVNATTVGIDMQAVTGEVNPIMVELTSHMFPLDVIRAAMPPGFALPPTDCQLLAGGTALGTWDLVLIKCQALLKSEIPGQTLFSVKLKDTASVMVVPAEAPPSSSDKKTSAFGTLKMRARSLSKSGTLMLNRDKAEKQRPVFLSLPTTPKTPPPQSAPAGSEEAPTSPTKVGSLVSFFNQVAGTKSPKEPKPQTPKEEKEKGKTKKERPLSGTGSIFSFGSRPSTVSTTSGENSVPTTPKGVHASPTHQQPMESSTHHHNHQSPPGTPTHPPNSPSASHFDRPVSFAAVETVIQDGLDPPRSPPPPSSQITQNEILPSGPHQSGTRPMSVPGSPTTPPARRPRSPTVTIKPAPQPQPEKSPVIGRARSPTVTIKNPGATLSRSNTSAAKRRMTLKNKLKQGETIEYNTDEYTYQKVTKLVTSGLVEDLTKLLDEADDEAKFIAVRGNTGATALHHAAALGEVECLKLLLDRGANPNIADNGGETPLHSAARGELEALSVLLNNGAITETTSSHGHTPLHIAAIIGNLECLALLVIRGADVEARDRMGRTAMDLAGKYGHDRCAAYLRSVTEDTATNKDSSRRGSQAAGAATAHKNSSQTELRRMEGSSSSLGTSVDSLAGSNVTPGVSTAKSSGPASPTSPVTPPSPDLGSVRHGSMRGVRPIMGRLRAATVGSSGKLSSPLASPQTSRRAGPPLPNLAALVPPTTQTQPPPTTTTTPANTPPPTTTTTNTPPTPPTSQKLVSPANSIGNLPDMGSKTSLTSSSSASSTYNTAGSHVSLPNMARLALIGLPPAGTKRHRAFTQTLSKNLELIKMNTTDKKSGFINIMGGSKPDEAASKRFSAYELMVRAELKLAEAREKEVVDYEELLGERVFEAIAAGDTQELEQLLQGKLKLRPPGQEDFDTPKTSAAPPGDFGPGKENIPDNIPTVNVQVKDHIFTRPDGQTVLHHAAVLGEVECIELLLKYGANVNCEDSAGETPVHAAARSGEPKALGALLGSPGVQVEGVNKAGYTPLHTAALFGMEDCVRQLANAGASVLARCRHGMTARDLAQKYRHTACAIALEKAEAQVKLGNKAVSFDDVTLA